ncbi:MAG: tryptophan 2,3-dioxygenase [Deltaproteobacteria bacterium]|nr:tryptophan 2,3-dioxygenase [Deltaproteobacteria bacterium]
MELTYSAYLKLDQLLNSQQPLSPDEHDEMLFIVIHQSYELWFKQLLHEKELLNQSLTGGCEFQAMATLRRMLSILKTVVNQVDILETMTPLSFAAFRSRLSTASGFQSWQFRLLEFYLGFRDASRLRSYPESSEEFRSLHKALHEPSLFENFLFFVSEHYNSDIPEDILNRDRTQPYQGDIRVVPLLLNLYKEHPTFRMLCEMLTDFDEGFQEWRYRHVKMVERTIGYKNGTGGSEGVSYLRKSIFLQAFPDLWNIRSDF